MKTLFAFAFLSVVAFANHQEISGRASADSPKPTLFFYSVDLMGIPQPKKRVAEAIFPWVEKYNIVFKVPLEGEAPDVEFMIRDLGKDSSDVVDREERAAKVDGFIQFGQPVGIVLNKTNFGDKWTPESIERALRHFTGRLLLKGVPRRNGLLSPDTLKSVERDHLESAYGLRK